MTLKSFNLKWKNGKIESITGFCLHDALNRAGYHYSILNLISSWEEVDDLYVRNY